MQDNTAYEAAPGAEEVLQNTGGAPLVFAALPFCYIYGVSSAASPSAPVSGSEAVSAVF